MTATPRTFFRPNALALKERRGNLGSQLSGGEQQMLAIGRALTTTPGCCSLTKLQKA